MPRKPVWDKHAIKAEIHRRGQTLTSLDQQFGLNKGDCAVALDRRFPKGERAIAEFLQVPVFKLWPDRYDEIGVPIRYLRKPIKTPLSPAARNRINQARSRRSTMQGAA